MGIEDHLHRPEVARGLAGAATRLEMLRAHGRHPGTQLPAGALALLVTLSGRLELESQDARWELPRRSALVWREGPLRIASHDPCHWLMLYGSAEAWRPHVRIRPGHPQLTLFPWEGACPPDIARAMIRVARTMDGSGPARPVETARPDVVAELCALLDEQQAWLLPLLERCSGRTLQHRQRTLMRLLRVRNLIRRNGDSRIDLSRLAALANYSPCHLLRIYRDAFGETPSEYATALRQQRAWDLVRGTRMQVYEITELLGFESQSSFCRAFKSAFGATTSEVRRRHGVLATHAPAGSRAAARAEAEAVAACAEVA